MLTTPTPIADVPLPCCPLCDRLGEAIEAHLIALHSQEPNRRDYAVARAPGVPTGVPDTPTTVSQLGFHTDESPDPPKRMQSPHIHASE